MYSHHNPTIAEPIMHELKKQLGCLWQDVSYGNDSCASISCSSEITIYLPNAEETDEEREEHAEYVLFVYGEYTYYPSIEEVVKAAKPISRIVSEFNFAIRCAYADLTGALEAYERTDPHAHDWNAHQQSIRDLESVFPWIKN